MRRLTPDTLARARRVLLLIGMLAGHTAPAAAQTTPVPDLRQASIEELMQLQITSVGRKAQRVEDTPAAVYVITSDAIRRSGIRMLPELLRLAPGVQVSAINSSTWAVSIRGFNEQFSNKLLVLVDGRSVYTRTFSGALWDAEDLLLDDIDRIEIVRGPGGAVWGANAVNGVVNIVTKPARNTQGGLVRLGVGTLNHATGTARYGGTVGPAAYRVYSQWNTRASTLLADSTPAGDAWNSVTTGARLDWTRGQDEWSVDGSLRAGATRPLWKELVSTEPAPFQTDGPGSFSGGTLAGRWTRTLGAGSTLQGQSALTISRRSELVSQDENAAEVQLQYHATVAGRHDLVVGGGYRFVTNDTTDSFTVSLSPRASRTSITGLFLQDEIALLEGVHLTLGSKLEHDTWAGWGVQPTARLMWRPARRHRLWAAGSRALRTPSNVDRAVRYTPAVIPGDSLPIVIRLLGNPDYRTEEFVDVEAGYRLDLGSAFSLDATAFRGHYDGLTTIEPLAPVFEPTPAPAHVLFASRFENYLQADTVGVEVAAQLSLREGWRISGSYSGFRLTPHPNSLSRDADAADADGNAPGHQWQLHSALRIGPRLQLDAALFRVGRLRRLEVPAYTRTDVRAELRLTDRISAAVVGRNLSDPQHAEYGGARQPVVATRVQRGFDVHFLWRIGP